jgi:hypothetical protein
MSGTKFGRLTFAVQFLSIPEKIPMKLVTVSQMQAMEKEANASGLTYDQMMQNAGQGY